MDWSLLDPPEDNPLVALSPRMSFQWNVHNIAKLPFLNVGCCDDPLKFGPRAVHFDIDDWSVFYKKLNQHFVQGDAHELLKHFEPNSFDLVMLGDVVEHLLKPRQALLAAAKVTNRFLCFTIWEEIRLPKLGRHIEVGQGLANVDAQALGFESNEAHARALYPDRVGYDDNEVSHLAHIWRFDQEMVDVLVSAVCREAKMHIILSHKVPEVVHQGQQFYIWCVLLERIQQWTG